MQTNSIVQLALKNKDLGHFTLTLKGHVEDNFLEQQQEEEDDEEDEDLRRRIQ